MSLVCTLLILTSVHLAVASKGGYHGTRGNSLVEVEEIGKGVTSTGTRTRSKNIRTLQVQNECLLCTRLGATLLPDVKPNPRQPDVSCSAAQKDMLSFESGSTICKSYQDFLEPRCCDQSSFLSSYECNANVRSMILDDSYTSIAPVDGSDGGNRVLDVDTLVTFISVKNIDVKTSTMEIFVNVDLRWNDPRLKWNVTDSNCVASIKVRADPSVEETEIWVPSLDLMNRATSIQEFPATRATVSYDGTVDWSRLGSLTAICTFEGLRRMPFDDLSCTLLFGDNGGSTSVEYKLREEGNNRTNGLIFYQDILRFTEFSVEREKAETLYPDIWNANTFSIKLVFQRAKRHYFMFTIFPSVLFTIMSFGQFALDVRGGERLSFSITVVLITVTQSIVTAEFLPVCKEMLWINAFNFVSLVFTLCGIVETLVVLWYLTMTNKEKKPMKEDDDDDQENESLLSHADSEENIDNSIQQSDSLIVAPSISDLPPHQRMNEAAVDSAQSDQQTKKTWKDRASHIITTKWKDYTIVKAFTTKVNGAEDFVKRLDLVFIVLLPIAYFLFLIIMFSRNSRW